MADIELVIKMPKETVNAIKDNVMFTAIPSEILWDVTSAIVNGTPLPKGHGRLIDADKLELDDGYSNYDGYYHKYSQSQIYNAPTIIEADKESEDKE